MTFGWHDRSECIARFSVLVCISLQLVVKPSLYRCRVSLSLTPPLTLPSYIQVIALITLSLVAGFSVDPEAVCKDNNGNNFTVQFSTKYPFRQYTRHVINSTTNLDQGKINFGDAGISQSAQFVVAWGSLTLFYGVIAILVYMLVTGSKELERIFDYLIWTVSDCQDLISMHKHQN